MSWMRSAKAAASLPRVPYVFFGFMCYRYTSKRKNLSKGSVFARHCNTEFMKQVLPRFWSPVRPPLNLSPFSKRSERGRAILSSSSSISCIASGSLDFRLRRFLFSFFGSKAQGFSDYKLILILHSSTICSLSATLASWISS